MTFRCKVHDCPRTAAPQKITNQLSIADISMHERVARIRRNLSQIPKISGIGKLVQIDNRGAFSSKPLQDEIGADETGSSSNQNGVVDFQARSL